MSVVVAVGLSAFTSPVAEFIVLIATLAILALRAWATLAGYVVTRRVTILVNVVVALMVFVFLFLVYARFKVLAS